MVLLCPPLPALCLPIPARCLPPPALCLPIPGRALRSTSARGRRGNVWTVASFQRIAWLAIVGVSLAWPADAPAVVLTVTSQRLDVANATQRWSCLRDGDGRIGILTSVRDDATDAPPWRPLFDGLRPLVEGADFDLHPEGWTVVEQSPSRAVILLTGKHPDHGYPWDARLEVDDRTTLVRLVVTCRLDRPIVLRDLEPQFALWMNRPSVKVALDQGPGSIDQGPAERQWGNSFPAAYLWEDGSEAALFVDGGALDWMSPRNLYRFRDCRVATFTDPPRGQTGLGLQVVKRNFHELAAGDIVWDVWIHAARAPEPTLPEALSRLMASFAPLHPSTAPPLVDRFTGRTPSWRTIAAGVDVDLRRRGIAWDDVPLGDAAWNDAPLFPEETVTSLRVATDYGLASSCDPARDRAHVADGWDFSTCHNGLGCWLGHDRIVPDADRRAFLREKLRGLRLFYDSSSGLIRHGTRIPPHVGDKEMAWQSLMFAIETARIWQTLERDDVDPAIGGIALAGTDGLVELAVANDHLFPQWFDPVTKLPLPQADQPELGVVFEPWQLGSYAWLLTEAHGIDGDPRRIKAAAAALTRLSDPRPWRVANARYDVTYDDPTSFPVTEIFGNAWGIAACCRLRAITGEDRYDAVGDAFLDTLLRLTPWYESALRDDPRDRAVRNAGLFRNHAGAFTGSPWENVEAALALSVRIRDDLLRDRVPRTPLLGLMNLQRVNAATFFPRCVPDAAQACPRLTDHPASSLPIEDAYTPEHGGLHGGLGRAVYMAGAAFAYERLFEALGLVDDPDLMLLNLDAVEGAEASLRGLERHFVLFNPTGDTRRVRLSIAPLPAGHYEVGIGAGNAILHTADDLRSGFFLDVAAGDHLLIAVRKGDAAADWDRLAADRRDADSLAAEWAALHRDLRRDGPSESLFLRRDAWRNARASFREGGAVPP